MTDDPPNETITVSAEDISYLDDFLTDYGVSPENRAQLISKFQTGEAWDSLTGIPVSTDTFKQGFDVVTVDTYADGSISVSTAPDLEAIAQESASDSLARSVHGCSFSGSNYAGYWNNCMADVNQGVIRLYFTFDYQNVRDQGAKITAYRNAGHHVVGATIAPGGFARQSNTAVRYNATVNYYGGIGSQSVWIQANVSGNQASTTSNL